MGRMHVSCQCDEASLTSFLVYPGVRTAWRSAGTGLAAGCLHSLSGPDHLAVSTQSSAYPPVRDPMPSRGLLLPGFLLCAIDERMCGVGSDSAHHWKELCSCFPVGSLVGLWPLHRPAHPRPCHATAEGLLISLALHLRSLWKA